MTELQVDQATAAYLAAQAARAGLSPGQWLAKHVRGLALRESAATHTSWYAARPGLVEAELLEAQVALDDADNRGPGHSGAA